MKVWIPHEPGVALLGELPAGVRVEVWDGEAPAPAEIEQAGFYVPPWVPGEAVAEALRSMPELDVVQALTAGIDLVRPVVPAGVTLCDARGVHDAATSEWVLGAILASLREFPRLVHEQMTPTGERRVGDTLDGKRVMILGYGSIGQAVERRLAGFDVELTRVARRARDGVHPTSELDELLGRIDVLIVLVPRTPETMGIVSRERLAALPTGALVVNAARGGLVDEGALLEELHAGRLRAALDVAEPDPLPAGHPLREAPGLFYTPHVAGATHATLSRIYGFIASQIRRLAAGEPLENVVA